MCVCVCVCVCVQYLMEADLISEQLKILLQLQVVLFKEAVKRHLHVPELGQQPDTHTHTQIL